MTKRDQKLFLEDILEAIERIQEYTQEKKMLERQITSTDKQIDKLVYELYSLTDEEIQIIEK